VTRKQGGASFGELLKGDLYQEEPVYNMTGLYYTILADVIRATFNASVNGDIAMFVTSTKDLLDISTPVFIKRDAEKMLKEYREKLAQAEIQITQLMGDANISAKHKQDIITGISQNVGSVRRQILRLLTPILLTTDKVLTKLGALNDATGAGNPEDYD